MKAHVSYVPGGDPGSTVIPAGDLVLVRGTWYLAVFNGKNACTSCDLKDGPCNTTPRCTDRHFEKVHPDATTDKIANAIALATLKGVP